MKGEEAEFFWCFDASPMAPKALDYESLNENAKKVMALCQAPFLLDDPNVGLMFPIDAISKAKYHLSLTTGGLGMYVSIFLLFGTVEDRSIKSSL
ncbi:Glutamate--glyoxylate aminotransferase 1, partial [Linum perenne]